MFNVVYVFDSERVDCVGTLSFQRARARTHTHTISSSASLMIATSGNGAGQSEKSLQLIPAYWCFSFCVHGDDYDEKAASHNPKEYNGMKLYMRGGAQIVEPEDREIADKIYRQQSLWTLPPAEAIESKDITTQVAQSYIQAVAAEVSGRAENVLQGKIVYTPLHGVVRERVYVNMYVCAWLLSA